MSQLTPESLYETLRATGFEPRVLRAQGGAVLLTVRGGRVLGIHLDGFPGNLLWCNEKAVSSIDSAHEFVSDVEWNIGGDRLWLGPEIELNFINPERPSPEDYLVPPAIDPGSYAIEREAPSAIALHNAGRAANTWTHGTFTFLVRRDIHLCEPPLATEGLSYVGFETSSYLEIQSPDHLSSRYGMWHLMQLPAGGVVSIPCEREPQPVDYFQTNAAAHCTTSDGGIAFPVTGRARHKLGISSHDARGRMGYLRSVGEGRATLIVRQAAVFPGAVYADYPAHDRQRRDIAIQLYNDDGRFGGFGEMEYHTPAAGPEGMHHSRDVSRTWCFGGDEPRIHRLAERLLGVPIREGA